MKVARIQIKNFLSIGEVDVEPGKVTQIVGRNNQGKTSILRALEVAVKGSTEGSLVKRGEDEAEIFVEFDDSTTIRRRIRSDGKNTVEVRKGNFKADKPQSLLDSLFAAGTFNPLALLEAKKRTEVLLSAIPIVVTKEELEARLSGCPVGVPPVDLDQHGLKVAQQAHKILYARRAEANKEAKTREETARVKRAELPEMPDTTDPRTAAEIQNANGQLEAQIQAERDKQKEVEAQAKFVQNAETWVNQCLKKSNDIAQEIAVLKARLEELEKNHATAHSEGRKAEAALREAKKEAAAAGPDGEKIFALNASIQRNLQELNIRSQIQNVLNQISHVETLEKQSEEAKSFAAKIDAAVKAVGPEFRTSLIEKADLPVKGLTFENDEFLLDGCHIDNLSSSRALKLALAVARATAGEAKLICLDGAEALDETTWTLLRQEIHGDEYQYFVTKVGEPFLRTDGDEVVQMNGGVAS